MPVPGTSRSSRPTHSLRVLAMIRGSLPATTTIRVTSSSLPSEFTSRCRSRGSSTVSAA